MMEMRECKLFLGNLSVCEQLSRREKAGKLELYKKDFRILQPREPIICKGHVEVGTSRGGSKETIEKDS